VGTASEQSVALDRAANPVSRESTSLQAARQVNAIVRRLGHRRFGRSHASRCSMKELRADCDQSLIEDYFQQELQKASTILPLWDGGTVWFWEFDRELFSVTLRIEKEAVIGNLTIICTTPISQSGPFEWQDCEVRITKDQESFVVSDAKAAFRLRACVVDVVENCEPLNFIFKDGAVSQ
jgi:hypothetical protein